MLNNKFITSKFTGQIVKLKPKMKNALWAYFMQGKNEFLGGGSGKSGKTTLKHADKKGIVWNGIRINDERFQQIFIIR